MKHVVLGAALAALGIVCSSAVASAATVTYTFSGTVIDQLDNANQFNGMNLVGQSFTDVESFELSTGNIFSNSEGYGYNGGAQGGSASAFGKSVLTVGALTITTAGSYLGQFKLDYPQQYVVSPPSAVETLLTSANNSSNYINMQESFSSPDLGDGYNSTTINGTGNGSYTVASGQDFGFNYSYLSLQSNKLVISSDINVSAVPLPGSAPMFGAALAALGIVGFGVKRRKAPTA